MNADTEKKALCSHDDPELWFPDKASRDLEAVRICNVCPIQVPCLQFALDNDMAYGVWGGKTEDERAELMQTHTPPPEQADKEKVRPLAGHGKSSEIKGVTWNRWRTRWEVIIRAADKKHYGGTHMDKEHAEAKALAMHQKLGTSPVRRGGRKVMS